MRIRGIVFSIVYDCLEVDEGKIFPKVFRFSKVSSFRGVDVSEELKFPKIEFSVGLILPRVCISTALRIMRDRCFCRFRDSEELRRG